MTNDEKEDRGVQMNSRPWPTVRNGLITGSALGAFLTFVIRWIGSTFADGDTLTTWLLTAPYVATLWPAIQLSRVLGWAWPIGGSLQSVDSVTLIYVTNSLLLGFFGALVGWLVWICRIKSK